MQANSYKTYINEHKSRFLEELFGWLRIPSVSADARYAQDVRNAATYLVERFKELGVNTVEVWETEGFPAVYAEVNVSDGLPTILVYGHYDVQPADPLELWKSPAFEPEVRDGRIYARGATDDKGQTYMHVKALEVLMRNGGLPCNVKFFIEGEEEVGSANLEACLRKYADRLKADVLLISDTSMIANEVPSIAVGLRGLTYMEVEVTGPNRDLHSGVYGGAVDNPVNVLCRMISSLHDENRRITIPGFYDDVLELSPEERAELARIPFSQADYNAKLELGDVSGEAGYSTIERASIRPTLDVNGIWGGYTGEGSKTVLPSKAHAKISMRLVPNQHHEKIAALFEKHFLSIAPSTVQVKVTHHHGGLPFLTHTDSPGYKAAEAAMTTTFGKKPIPAREGGSIPIMSLFKEILGTPTVLMGFGLDIDAPHSPNESYGIYNYLIGIETIALFHHEYAKRVKAS